jgi:hypothetical protein
MWCVFPRNLNCPVSGKVVHDDDLIRPSDGFETFTDILFFRTCNDGDRQFMH